MIRGSEVQKRVSVTMEWYERPVRMMRWDYMQNISKMKYMDLEQLAKMKKQEWHINCEWLVGTPGAAPGLGYLTTFKAEGFERYPGLEDFDCLREYLPYAHKYGIKLLIYLNMHWYSYEFAKEHPDWEQKVPSGESYGKIHPLYGNGTTFCVNSPWRNWAFKLIKETMKTGVDGIFLDGPVIFPDCCYCQYCQERFKKDYGENIPEKENWRDPLWKSFVEFRRNSLAEFLRDAQKAMREINPKGVIFLNAGGWQPSGWRRSRDIEKMENYQDFNGAEEFFHPKSGKSILDSSMMAKYLRAGKKSAVVFNHYAMGSWHYVPLPSLEIKLALAQTIANRANPWIAVFDPLAENRGEKEPVAEILGFAERNEEYYLKNSSLAKIALHFSRQTSTYYFSEFDSLYKDIGTGREKGLVLDQGTGKLIIDWKKRKLLNETLLHNAYLGYYLSLTRNHILFDIILDSNLISEKLKEYEVLVLPNSSCLSENQRKAIKEFVEQGGKLFASFETGFYDERGNPLKDKGWQNFLGIEKIEGIFPPLVGENYITVTEKFASFSKGRLLERPIQALKVKARDGVKTPLFYLKPVSKIYMPLQEVSSYPALLISKYGEGKVIYSPSLLEAFYGEYRIENTSQLLTQVIRVLSSEEIIKINAPSTVEVEAYYQKDFSRYIIHLINTTGDMQRPIKEVIPIRNIKVSLKAKEVKKVYQLGNRKDVSFAYGEGKIEFVIPELRLYEVVVIEL